MWQRLIVFPLLLAVWLLAAAPSRAQPQLIVAEPTPESRVETQPEEIRLTFSEPVTADSTITLLSGAYLAVEGVRAIPDPGAPEQLVAALPPDLAPGLYLVEWTAVGEDGRAMMGSFGFTLGGTLLQREGLGETMLLIILMILGAVVLLRVIFLRRNPPQDAG